MKTTALSTFTALLILFACTAAQAQFNFTTNNGEITITGYTGSGGVVLSPGSTNGLLVTTIGKAAFSNCTSLVSVTIPDGVKTVEESAFFLCSSLTNLTLGTNVATIGRVAFGACSGLASVLFPDSLTAIADWAFSYCDGLTAARIPDHVTNIGVAAFAYSSVADVTFGHSVVSIGRAALTGCTGLTNVTFATNLTTIGIEAFLGTALTSVTIPHSVTNIAIGAFDMCRNLTAITVDPLNPAYSTLAGVLFDKSQQTLIQCPGGRLGSYTIPGTVTRIANNAFDTCVSLTSVTFPGSVTTIGDWAFRYCYHLTELYFQGNAPSIGSFPPIFDNSSTATIYYLPGTTGWTPTFGGRPTAFWFLPGPLILTAPGFGLQTNAFGFIISWATTRAVLVEASTNLADQTWLPLRTNTLTNGSIYFSDPDWTTPPARFYRLRSL